MRAQPNTDYSLLRVVVMDANERTNLGTARLHGDGSFHVERLPEAVVDVQLVSPHGESILHRYIALPAAEPVRLEMPEAGAAAGSSVSLYRLQYRPSDTARRSWDAAVAALRKHDWPNAAIHLEEAIRAAPDYAEAHEHRGLIALAAGQYTLAAEHLIRAAGIDPADPQYLSNAALACLALGRDREAEEYARSMLRIEPGSERGYFILGTALARQDRNRGEAIQALSKAQAVFPEARVALQRLR